MNLREEDARRPKIREDEIRKFVVNYLSKRGFRQTEQMFREESRTRDIEDLAVDQILDQHTASLGNALFFNNAENDPARYDESYGQLRDWIQSSLDLYKAELMNLTYPVFVHIFLELISKGYSAQARDFLAKHSPGHTERHGEQIQSLEGIFTTEHLNQNEVASYFVKNKVAVRLSSYSYRLLIDFLHQNRFMSLISIINQRIDVKVLQGMPSPTGEEEPVVPLAGSSTEDFAGINRKEIYWGELQPDEAFKDQKGDGAEDKGNREDGGPPTAKKSKKDAAEAPKAPPPEKPSRTRVPLPKLSERVESEVFEDVRKRVALSSNTLPSVCFYTFLNTHGGLNTVEISADGSIMAAGFDDSSATVWLLKPSCNTEFSSLPEFVGKGLFSGMNPLRLIGHSGPIYSMSLSPDKTFLLTSSEDNTVRLWSLEFGSNLVVYKGHNYSVWSVDFSSLGYYFATASHDRTARIWSTDHIYPLRILTGHLTDVDCVKFHPNCNYVATGSGDKTIRLWDMNSAECVRIMSGHRGPVNALSFSPDGRYLASAGEDKDVLLWDLASGQRMETFSGHDKSVWSVDWSYDGNLISSASADCSIRLWDPHYKTRSSTGDDVPPRTACAKTLRTKSTSVILNKFTRRNLLLAAGPFSLH